MIRIELRCSPPSRHSPSRAGILVADFHRLKFISDDYSDARSARFMTSPVQLHTDSTSSIPLLRVQCGNILFAFCPVGETVASIIAMITSLDDFHGQEAMDHDGLTRTPLEPRMSVLKIVHASSSTPMTTLHVNIPSIYIDLGKEALDGLLVWADDATQLIERMADSQDVEIARSSTSAGNPSVAHLDASSQKTNPFRVTISITEG
jgi:hypothetical protein